MRRLSHLGHRIAGLFWLSKSIRLKLLKYFAPEFEEGCVFETEFFGYVYQGNTQNLIDRKVLLSGCHECDVLAFIRDFLESRHSPGCIDIGANIGHHALFMAKYSRKVLAFEPFEPVRKQLLEKIELNKVENIECFPIALGDSNEEQRFYAPPEGNLGMGSFVEEFSSINRTSDSLVVKRADDYFQNLEIEKIDFIKLDVEGYEKNVLSGMPCVLDQYRPTVLFESSLELKDSLDSMRKIEAVFPEGYTFYRFSHDGKRRHGKYKLLRLTDDMFHFRRELSVIAAPNEVNVPISTSRNLIR